MHSAETSTAPNRQNRLQPLTIGVDQHAAIDMAHAARVSDLVDGLIHSITGARKTDPSAKQLKASVAKGLRDQSHGRTNPFDVKSKLDGLVEKFAVRNREDLSDALQARLEELPPREKWLPENLSLLLLLSDRPVERTDLAALKALQPDVPAEEQLTWDEIVADDPLDEAGLWDDVEHGYHSSGDEVPTDGDSVSERTTSTGATSVSGESVERLARLHLVQPSTTELSALESAQSMRSKSFDAVNLSLPSLMIVRETLAMLRGWASDLYLIDQSSGSVSLSSSAKVSGVNITTLKDVLFVLAEQGTALHSLRRWVRSHQPQPWQRICQASIAKLLSQYSAKLAALEEGYVGPVASAVVSIADVLDETRNLSRIAVKIATLVAHEQKAGTSSPFALMDGLYAEACSTQMAGDDEALVVFSELLYESVKTYLRDIGAWITSGAPPSSDEHSLVVEAAAQCTPGDLWHAQFSLRRLDSGMPSVPNFLAHKANALFAFGKARMLLSHLSLNNPSPDERSSEVLAGPDFTLLRSRIQEDLLMPFEDLFEDTITTWIASIDTNCTPSLKQALLHQHGLLDAIQALEQVYLCAGGAQLEAFALSLFNRVDRKGNGWREPYLLTELVREILGEPQCVQAEALSITFDSAFERAASVSQSLQGLQLHYHFTWPVQNITRESAPEVHCRAFAFLLQVHRAYYVMRKQSFALRHLPTASELGPIDTLIRLRQVLICLTNVLHAHIATAGRVLGAELRAQMMQASDVDAMVAVYAKYKSRLENVLLLTPKLQPIRGAITSMLELVERSGKAWEEATGDGKHDYGRARAAAETARRLLKEYGSSLAFLTAGVRGVSRAGGEVLLEALAERLEWMVP